jgi:hypothetical protein
MFSIFKVKKLRPVQNEGRLSFSTESNFTPAGTWSENMFAAFPEKGCYQRKEMFTLKSFILWAMTPCSCESHLTFQRNTLPPSSV